jgi:peroxiredoxin
VSDAPGGEDEDRAAGQDRAAGEGQDSGHSRPSLQRLDPDRAAPPIEEGAAPRPAPPAIDTRPYRWIVGIIGLALVVAISVYQFASHGVGNTGVTAGHPLPDFAAPLAATNLNGDANAHPTCSAARHDPRALNVCLLARRGPLVLSFFVTGAGQCVRQVSALQTLAGRFPSVQFAAVAVAASHKATAKLVREHRWTIPVAYDPDGRVGELYGVAACPMVELVDRGGVVRDRLVGNRWQTAAALAPRVQALLGGGAPAG